MSYEKPRPRKGYTVTAVHWDRAGKVRFVKYEPNGSRAGANQADSDTPAPNAPERDHSLARGILAAELATRKATQPDLF